MKDQPSSPQRTLAKPASNQQNQLLVATLASAVIAALLTALILSIVPPSAPADLNEFIASTTLQAGDFKPEPVESRAYLLFLVLLAVSLVVTLRLLQPIAIAPIAAEAAYVVVAAGVLASIWLASPSSWDASLYTVMLQTELMATLPAPLLLTAAFLGFVFYRRELGAMVLPLIAVLIFITGLVMQISENDSMAVSPHFLILTAPLLDVSAGKTLLVDLPGQYGLWPHFLEPWFQLIGLSVSSVAATFNVITVASLCLIYTFFSNCIAQSGVRLAGFASLMSVSVYLGRYIVLDDTGIVDPYYQFWSVRLLFPALLIALVVWQQRGRWQSVALPGTALFALGAYWNLDTGVPCLLVWLAVQTYRMTEDNAVRQVAIDFAKHLLVVVGVTVLVLLGLFFRSGQWPDVTQLILFQKLFAQYGYYMLPLPILHPWNIVVLIYALAIGYALINRGKQPVVLMLGLLGFGLLPYYVGRSHELVFLMVMFPAIMLASLYVDRNLAVLQKKWQFNINAITTSLLALLLVATASSLLVKLPALGEVTLHRLAQMQRPPYQRTEQVQALYRQAIQQQDRETVFLSHHATYWHLVTQSFPMVTDEYLTFVFRDQYQALAAAISQHRPIVMLEKNYAKNPDGEQGEFHQDRQKLLNDLVKAGYRPQLAIPDSSFQYWDVVTAN